LLTIGPGPDKGGSKVKKLRPHMPDKSGIDATPAALTAPNMGASCLKAGFAAAAPIVTNMTIAHCDAFMLGLPLAAC
jgi:hypothetical protein